MMQLNHKAPRRNDFLSWADNRRSWQATMTPVRHRLLRRTARNAGLLCAALLVTASAQASVLHVPRDHASIQDAVNAAATGDLVLVRSGSYALFWFVSKTDVTVRGLGRVVINASTGTTGGTGIHVQNSIRCKLENLRIREATEMGIWVQTSTDIEIRRCRIEDAAEHGIAAHGNRVAGALEAGIRVDAVQCNVSRNQSKRSGTNGLDIRYGLDWGNVTGNKVIRSQEAGMIVFGSSNTIAGNRVRQSGDLDIRAVAPPASNMFVDNVYETSNL